MWRYQRQRRHGEARMVFHAVRLRWPRQGYKRGESSGFEVMRSCRSDWREMLWNLIWKLSTFYWRQLQTCDAEVYVEFKLHLNRNILCPSVPLCWSHRLTSGNQKVGPAHRLYNPVQRGQYLWSMPLIESEKVTRVRHLGAKRRCLCR